MQSLNELVRNISHDYLLLTIGAALFLAVKAVLGYLTYRHYNKRLEAIEAKIDALASNNRPGDIKR